MSRSSNYYIMALIHLFLLANHLPTVLDALIFDICGEHSDRERAILMMKLSVPQNIASAVGPYLALQVFSSHIFREKRHFTITIQENAFDK